MTLTLGQVLHHSVSLVLIAGVLCAAGAWATSRFFQRMTVRDGERYAWLFLTALASGVTIWCTHFIAMLGYDPGVEMSFAWLPTTASLVIATVGSAVGFLIASGTSASRALAALGGIVVGLSVASMHYVGMSAIRMGGSVTWDVPLVALSVVLGVVLAVAALVGGRSGRARAADLMWGLFSASVLLMHVTGMTAMHVTDRVPGGGPGGPVGPGGPGRPADGMSSSLDPHSQYVLALAVAGMSFVTIGAGMVGYMIDNRARALSVARLRRLALFDALTGLPNRASLNERLDREIGRAAADGTRLALVVVDVDSFKEINDLHGHLVGDEVLRVLGRRMADLTRDADGEFIARMGGDEFVALCRLAERPELDGFLDTLRQVLSGVIRIGEGTLVPRASIGAAVFPDDAPDAETLVNNADLAMYRAKGDALHDLCVYDASVDEPTRLRRGLTADLREALGRGELFLHYQVQSAVTTGEARGFEALLRWQHPGLGLVSPAEFIPLAEDSGLIVPIGEWVLRTACAEAARWQPPYRVAVNVSAVQLTEPGLADTVRQALEESGLEPPRLELEMTETAVFADRDLALRTLQEIKELGVGIALDDFGVGYSSLDALRSFPFDRIKIDRSFFTGPGPSTQTVELVRVVLALGRALGMAVLAEGIETADQLAMLTDAGCDEAQGFLFGRPTHVDDIVRSGRLGIVDRAATTV